LTEYYSESSGAEHANQVINLIWWHQTGYKTLNLEGWLWTDVDATAVKVRIELLHLDSPYETWYYDETITATSYLTGKQTIKVDISGRTVGQAYQVSVLLYVTGSGKKLHLQLPAIWASEIADGEAMTMSLP